MQRSSTVTPPQVHAAHTTSTTIETTHANRRKLSRVTLVSSALLVLALLTAGTTLAYGAAHDGRVFRGVAVLGKDLGGMSAGDAKAALAGLSGYPSGSLSLSGAGHNWTLTPAELGVALDPDKTVSSALSVGRTSNLFGNLGGQVGALFSHIAVTPVLRSDSAAIDRAIATIASQVDVPAVSSRLELKDGAVVITPSSHGSIVDRDATRAAILAAVASVPFSGASVVMHDAAPQVTEPMLKSVEAQALLLVDQPLTLRSGKKSWTLTSNEIGSMLDISTPFGDSEHWAVALSERKLADYLAPIATVIKVAPTDASVTVGKGTVTLKKDVPGSELDTAPAVQAIQQAATGTDAASRTVDLPLKAVPAAVHTADLQDIYNKANALVTQGIRLRFRDDAYTIRGTSVTGFLDIVPDANGGYKLQVDDDVLADRISGIGYYINRIPVDARFRMVGNTPTKVSEAKEGYKVNVPDSVQTAKGLIASYAGGDKLQVDLNVDVTQPFLKDADLSTINTPDLLGTGQTSYANSSAERAWNVGLGTRNVDGALIPPGGTFSTVETIGDLTLAAGFKMGYAIVNTGNGLTTVPAEAGGICQVATTLFHSVFWSGLPIVERNWHSYWIGLYGLPPSGLQGLDATIAPPEKDFRFRNTTGNWLRIHATADGTSVIFQLYGVNPGWKVNVSGPVITNKVKTTQNPITEYSDKLPAGKKVLVEHAQDGFDASITRVVTDKSGSVIDKWVAKSHYQTAHNRTLIGTGK